MILKNKFANLRFILTVLSIIFIFTSFNFHIVSAVDNKYNINLKVSYGVDEKYKVNSKAPINVVVTNNGVSFQGKIQIETLIPDVNKYDLNTESINIAENTTKSLWYNLNIEKRFKIRLITDNNEVIHEETINVNKGRLKYEDILVGVLTDDFNGLSYISNVNLKDNYNKENKKMIPVSLSEELIENNPKSLDIIDMIIINNYDTAKLTEDSVNKLNQWIDNGGTLVVGTGENYKKVLGGINGKIINGTFSEATSRDISIGEISAKALAVNMNIEKSIDLFSDKDKSLISKVIKQNGQVIIFPWDLATEEISKFNENSSMWGLVTADISNTIRKNKEGLGGIGLLLGRLKDIRLPSFQLMMILFIVYILIIGVLIYIVLKRLNKRDYVWVLIPIISIGFTVLIYFIGSNSRIQDIIANKINIISIDAKGQTEIESYLGILTAKVRKVVIEEPEDVDLNLIENQGNYYGDSNYINDENATMRLNTIIEGNKKYYNFDEKSSFYPEVFRVDNLNVMVEPLEYELRFSSGKLMGYINNNLGCDIKKLIVMTPSRIWDLGSLADGKKISIEDSDKFTSALNMWEIEGKIEKDYDDNIYKKEKSKNYELRTYRLLDYINNNSRYGLNENTSKLIAVTEKKIEYGLKVNGKAPLDQNDTIFINAVKINYRSEDGSIEYPYGYFTPYIIEQNDIDGYYDPMDRTIDRNVELVLGYKLQEDDETIEGINFKKDYSKGNSIRGEYKIYNYKINDYELLNFNDELNLTNVSDYILDGNIKIKIQGNNEVRARIPDISAKGKVK
jgi:hypothetical protein